MTPEGRPIRVLIVDDSPFVRKALLRVFSGDPATEVVGAARDGREAVEKALDLRPDVVTLDIMMPVMDGIETLKALMERHPVAVLMLSQFTHEGAELTLKALELGAMDFVDKSTTGAMDFLALSREILSKVKAIAGHKPKRLDYEAASTEGFRPKGVVDAVAIGASTGGPPALQMILQKLPEDINFGVLIVQHMPKGFTGPLAERLDRLCPIKAKEAEDGDRVEPGLALIAPSGLHMGVRNPSSYGRGSAPAPPPGAEGPRTPFSIKLGVEPVNLSHRPSVDVLFESVARVYGPRSIAVLLTGMGADGAKGMAEIKQAGGLTIAQDEATSTIFGMPKAAISAGAARKVLPITEIADEILRNV